MIRTNNTDKMDVVRINVGGSVFMTHRRTILNLPSSTLSHAIGNADFYENSLDMFFFDRRPALFETILEAHRSGEVHVPSEACGSELVAELQFWNIPMTMIAPCCIGKVRDAITERVVAQTVADEICSDCDRSLDILSKSSEHERRRIRAWLFLEFPVGSTLAKAWTTLMAIVIISSLFTFGLHFDTRLMMMTNRTQPAAANGVRDIVNLIDTDKWRWIWTAERWWGIYVIDITINLIIALELIVRFLVCPYKMRFLRFASTVIELIILVTYFLSMALAIALAQRDSSMAAQWGWLVMTSCQLLRPLRVIRLANIFVGLRVLLLVLRKSRYELLTVLTFLGIGMMTFAFLIFAAEMGVAGHFVTIWDGAWWAVITMTTVGYGDMVPKSPFGHFVGIACAISGVIIVGFSIPILSTNFTMYYGHVHLAVKKMEERLRTARQVLDKNDQNDHGSAKTAWAYTVSPKR